MDINDVKTELDNLYKQYKKQKSTLDDSKTKKVVKLLKQLLNNGNAKDIAEQLAKFSPKLCEQFFDELTKGYRVPLNGIESIINSYISCGSANTDTRNELYYIKNYATMATKVINNYTDLSYNSKTIAQLIAQVAYLGIKSDSKMKQFERVVSETKGKVYLVDYRSIKGNSLANIKQITNILLTKGRLQAYTDLIEKWFIKYGFTLTKVKNISVSKEQTVKQDKTTTDTLVGVHDASKSIMDDMPTVASEKVTNKPSVSPLPEKESPRENTTKNLYIALKRDMDKEQEAIVTAFTNMITPIGKAFENIQGEINKSREIGSENVKLKSHIIDLERQLLEQRETVQMVNQSLLVTRTENDELKKQVSLLERKNTELDIKLNDAYAINSRESSLEAERIRSELKKAFVFLYEDWLEYEFSDVSEENYESLQAIIKKIFRSLERNGIDFKGNN